VFTLEVFLNNMRILVYAVLCFALCTATLVAQPAAVTVISGNGQMTCLICLHASLTGFDPMVVQVTDAKGNPVISTPVVWTVAGGSAYFISSGANTVTTNTDNNGYASAQIAQTAAIESGPQFGLVSTVTASATGVTATLYESQGAPVENPGPGTIDVNVNYQNAPEYVTITGTAGSAGPSFTIGVYTDSGTGIPNVAMMLMNEDGSVGPSATIPSAYCQTQPGAGLYTVLSPSSGVATCNVIFGPVAGSGTYEIVTGGSTSSAVR
jgi:hypothetical protein